MVHYLSYVKTFLDANPSEVLTLLFTNPEGQSVQDVWKPAFDAAGNSPSSNTLFVMTYGNFLNRNYPIHICPTNSPDDLVTMANLR